MISKILNIKNKYPTRINLVEAILSGLLLGVGFIVPILWPLGLVGIILCLDLLKRNSGIYQTIFFVFVAWLIKSVIALSFFWDTYPITWTGLQEPLWQVFAIAFYWLTNSLWLALGSLVFVGLVLITKKKRFYPDWLQFVFLPLFWLVGELAGAWSFSFFTSGPDSLLQTHFSIGMAGYLLANSSFGIWTAGLAGVYGLSIVFVFLAVVSIELLNKNKKSRFFIFPVLLIIFYANWSYCISEPVSNEDRITVFSVNTKFSSSLLRKDGGQEEKYQTLTNVVEKGLSYNPDFILLPEDSRYLNYNYSGIDSHKVMPLFLFTHPGTETTLIDSGRADMFDGTGILRANIFDSRSGKLYKFDKQYLVPQGEFLPYFYSIVLRLFGFGKVVDGLSQKISYRRGPLLQTADIPAYIPGILFCFESIRPDGVRSLAKERNLPFVAHPISHAWFHSSQILRQQQDLMLRVQARWQGVPIVSAGNMMQGKLYLPNGQIDNGEIIESGDSWNITKFVF